MLVLILLLWLALDLSLIPPILTSITPWTLLMLTSSLRNRGRHVPMAGVLTVLVRVITVDGDIHRLALVKM